MRAGGLTLRRGERENERRVPKSGYSLDQILALTLELTRLLRETATLEKICFGAGESNPDSSKVTTFSLRDGVPWVISAKEVFTILATDLSVEDCVSWLGAAGHYVFIASATASCTALEMEAERACILTAIRGCSVEVTAC